MMKYKSHSDNIYNDRGFKTIILTIFNFTLYILASMTSQGMNSTTAEFLHFFKFLSCKSDVSNLHIVKCLGKFGKLFPLLLLGKRRVSLSSKTDIGNSGTVHHKLLYRPRVTYFKGPNSDTVQYNVCTVSEFLGIKAGTVQRLMMHRPRTKNFHFNREWYVKK